MAFNGALSAKYVLQELIRDTEYTPCYFGTDTSTFEQDFLIQKEIVSIEVKAEANLTSRSLKAYCDKYHPGLLVRFTAMNYVDQERMCNLPLYAVCTL